MKSLNCEYSVKRSYPTIMYILFVYGNYTYSLYCSPVSNQLSEMQFIFYVFFVLTKAPMCIVYYTVLARYQFPWCASLWRRYPLMQYCWEKINDIIYFLYDCHRSTTNKKRSLPWTIRNAGEIVEIKRDDDDGNVCSRFFGCHLIRISLTPFCSCQN